jgi:methyl-accepting chemotaxis protein
VETSALLQQARFQVRGYTYSGKAEFQQTALTAIDQALAVLAPAGQAARRTRRQPRRCRQALAAYRDAVNQFGSAQSASEQALQRMAAQGRCCSAPARK